MSMGIGTNTQKPDEGELKRKMKEIAFYCGIPIQEFCCSTVVENQEYLFRLYYYPESHCWKVSWGEE